ncbi:hypothetical protein NDU88_003115 [Pleurodeles waltl]|uniref:Uncharacterized protein n=1 Tax=Pleurodeles waltl TaxID=8319 RepID=A0AAV7MZ94_PLEWA|nr:hypothetical protein NDU88_003115 [Pleurodeles waltl]
MTARVEVAGSTANRLAMLPLAFRGRPAGSGGFPPDYPRLGESSMAALQAAPPWGFRPPSRQPVSGGFHRQKQDGGNGCRGPCTAHATGHATGMGSAGAP